MTLLMQPHLSAQAGGSKAGHRSQSHRAIRKDAGATDLHCVGSGTSTSPVLPDQSP